jgi:type I restriction enzyme R subunit
LGNDHAFLVDFNHVHQNRFVAINQFTILGTKQPRRPDIICFINGIPFAVLELKSPTDENADIWDAFNQLQTYKEEISDLFVFNEALVVSDGVTARVGSLTAIKNVFAVAYH